MGFLVNREDGRSRNFQSEVKENDEDFGHQFGAHDNSVMVNDPDTNINEVEPNIPEIIAPINPSIQTENTNFQAFYRRRRRVWERIRQNWETMRRFNGIRRNQRLLRMVTRERNITNMVLTSYEQLAREIRRILVFRDDPSELTGVS